MPRDNWQHSDLNCIYFSVLAHCWTAVSISRMSFLHPPSLVLWKEERGGKNGNVELISLQMVLLTSRTIRNCTMNNSAFCHFRGFPLCLYNSEHFLPSLFSLRRNCSWRSSLQGLPAAHHAGGICRGLRAAPAAHTDPVHGDLCVTPRLAMLMQLPNLRRHFL